MQLVLKVKVSGASPKLGEHARSVEVEGAVDEEENATTPKEADEVDTTNVVETPAATKGRGEHHHDHYIRSLSAQVLALV